MEENKSQQNLVRVIVLLAGLIFVALLTVGVIQTFVHNSLREKQRNLASQNQSVLDQTKKTEDEISIRESEEYLDEFYEQENEYGNEGDVIIKPNK